ITQSLDHSYSLPNTTKKAVLLKTALVISTRNFYFSKVSVICQFIWLRRTFGFLSCRQNDPNEMNRAKLKLSYYLWFFNLRMFLLLHFLFFEFLFQTILQKFLKFF